MSEYGFLYIDFEKVNRRKPMNIGLAIALIAVALVFGAGAGFLIRRLVAERKIGSARAEADRVVAEAAKKAEAVKKRKTAGSKRRNPAKAQRSGSRTQGTPCGSIAH